MPTIAKVGIGCGVLIAILVIAAAIIMPKVMKKVQEFAEDPSSLVVWAIEQPPETEVMSHDKEAKKITIKIVSTGEVLTANYGQWSEGKMVFTNAAGEEVEVIPSETGAFEFKPVEQTEAAPDTETAPLPAPTEQ